MTSLRPAFATPLLLAWLMVPVATAEAGSLPPSDAMALAAPRLLLAQAQPAPDAVPSPSATPPATGGAEPIGNVASLTGTVTVIRNKDSLPLKLRDDIYLNDVVQTSTASSLGITFDDGTTFRLSANARIAIDNYVYADGGQKNSAIFNVVRGTVAFAAAALARTGDMKIDTPTATLGIRGTTGLIEIPDDASAAGAAASQWNVAIKLYPDADGHVGHIDVNDRQGARLGALTQGGSGFSIRPSAVGAAARVSAVPLVIAARDVERDRGFVRELHASQRLGRRIVTEQRAFRRANPGLAPNRGGVLRPNSGPAQPQAPRNPQQSPALNGRQGLQQPGARPQPSPSPSPPASRPPSQQPRPDRQGLREAPQPQAPSPPAVTPGSAPSTQTPRPGNLHEATPHLQRPGTPMRPAPQRGRPAPRGKNKRAPPLR